MSFKKIRTDFLILLAKLLAKMPLSVILAFGGFVGYLFWLFPNSRKKIAYRNIQLCFPELENVQQKSLLKKNLISTGMGFSETLFAFWGSDEILRQNVQLSGIHHIEEALKNGNGCILLSCHLHSFELVIKAINSNLSIPGHFLARQHNNKIYEKHIDTARQRNCKKTIDKKDMMALMKSLKSNNPVYYLPDQDFSYQFEYIDFFSQPASTVIAPVRLARSTKVAVIPWFGFREKNEKGKYVWFVEILSPLNYFSELEVTESLTKMNELFEQKIRTHPEQYLWVHRRFKNHPKGKNYVYKDL